MHILYSKLYCDYGGGGGWLWGGTLGWKWLVFFIKKKIVADQEVASFDCGGGVVGCICGWGLVIDCICGCR